MQFLVLFRRKWPLTLLYRPPFILKLETPTFFGHHFFISFFLFHFPVHFIVFIVYSILPFSFLLFSHTKKDQVHKREKKKKKKKKKIWCTGGISPLKKGAQGAFRGSRNRPLRCTGCPQKIRCTGCQKVRCTGCFLAGAYNVGGTLCTGLRTRNGTLCTGLKGAPCAPDF